MPRKLLANLKGDKGDQGDQGLPGPNAIPADEAVAGYIETGGTSATKTALLSTVNDRIRDITATVNAKDYGADPDGVVPADTAWAALLADVPNGTRVILDGNFTFLEPIRNNGLELHVEAYGSTLTRDLVTTGDPQLVSFTGGYGAINPVSTMTVANANAGLPATTTLITTAAPVDLAVGDFVQVVADNFVPASRANTSRAAFSGVVADVTGATVTVFGAPYSGDPFTTNIRIAKVIPATTSWRGGTLKRAAAFITPAVGGSMMLLRDLLSATVSDVRIPLSSGAGFQVTSCYGTLLENLQINLLRDTWSDTGSAGAVLGYHVLDTNGVGTQLRDSRFFGGRHGYSTAQTSTTAGGDASNTNMRAFGVAEHAVVEGVHVEGTYVAAFDTHEASRGFVFDNCVAIGAGFAGFGLRGRDHAVSNSQAIDCFRGVYIFDGGFKGDSYGHKLSNLLIDNPRSNAIVADLYPDSDHPSYGVRQPVGVTAFEATGITVRGAKSAPVRAINARIGKVDLEVIWSATPTATQGVFDLVNSEVRGGTVHSDHRLITSNAPNGVLVAASGDTSVAELDSFRILGTTAQVDRIARATGGTATFILPDVLLDETPTSTATGATFTAGSVLDYRTLTGDDSGRIGIAAATTDLSLLGRSLHPVLTVQATITAAKTLPDLPAGKVQGQVLNILNRPATGVTGQSTANLTITHGGTPGSPTGSRTWLTGATNKVLTPGQSCRLQWDATIARWCEI